MIKTLAMGLCVAFVLTGVARANDGQAFANAMEAARQGDWNKATGFSRQAQSRYPELVITWMRLRDGQGSWQEYNSFLGRMSDWPGLPLMRKQAERVMPAQLPARDVMTFFRDLKPQTGRGAILLARAYRTSGQKAQGQAEAVRAWMTLSLNQSAREGLLADYTQTLSRHHWARTDMLLWRGLTKEAEVMLPYLTAGQQALAKARIGLRRKVNGVDRLIAAVPTALRTDGGLAYERFLWRTSKSRWDDAEALILAQSVSGAALGQPEAWSNRRRGLARRAMRDGRVNAAYKLASQHFMTEGSNYADLEWLAGYVALTRLNQPQRAVAHFERFRQAVFTPISLGRAGYWLGRAHEASGNTAAARQAYGLGATHQTSFYGQLSAERAGLPPDRGIAGSARAADWRNSGFARSSVVQAAIALHQAGETQLMQRFLLHANETLNAQESAGLAQLALDLGRPFAAVKIAKAQAREGVVIPQAYYPVTSLAQQAGPVRPELAMAIARQESELNPAAISPAGARGLMQLMPGTAQKVSRDLGIGYSKAALTQDPAYNARLGTTYLAQMMQRFDGSLILTAASYNAGPSRVSQWIGEYGDPRSPGVDPVDWIEGIPYRETRNYVMRVLEGLHVYRMRINRQAVPLQLSRDLRGS